MSKLEICILLYMYCNIVYSIFCFVIFYNMSIICYYCKIILKNIFTIFLKILLYTIYLSDIILYFKNL